MRISDWSSDVCSSDLDEPFIARRQHAQRRRLVRPLLAFEHQHLVELDPGLADASDGGDQHQCADGARIGRVGRAAISGKPAIQSRNSVPLQAVEIVPEGMEWRSRSEERRVWKEWVRTG